jgi:nanoRNase/pAp phosphatase (c-di-AMP/oligoRNAs hydrolase)
MNSPIARFLSVSSRWIVRAGSLNRTLSSSIKTNANKNEVIVIGHRNPDTDAITAAIVYTNFLRRMNIHAKAYRLGDPNRETQFVLKYANVPLPDLLPDDVTDGNEVALVDHNESRCEQ